MVLPEHRGHRLGMLVKVAQLRALSSALPHAAYVETTNAEGNEHMVAINEALGFRVRGRNLTVSKRLAPSHPV